MLLSKQIAGFAAELKSEAQKRAYVNRLIPDVADNEHFWSMIVELLEIVMHRHDFVVVERRRVNLERGEVDWKYERLTRAPLSGANAKGGSGKD